MRIDQVRFLGLLMVVVLVAGCNNAKRLPNGKYLLKRNEIQTNNPQLDKPDLESLIKQKPNKKALGLFRLKLTIYNWGTRIENDSSKIKQWMKNSAGERPVILDTVMTDNTMRQMSYYLENKGYFNSSIKKDIERQENKKAIVTYQISTHEPYRVRKVQYLLEDSTIRDELEKARITSLIQSGSIFDAGRFDDERDRLTEFLRNRGYYYFNKNFIQYKVDSAIEGHQLDVYIQINNRVYKAQMYNDSLVSLPHHKYNIRDVYIYPDFDALREGYVDYDTLHFEYSDRVYHYIYNKSLPYKPKSLNQFIFIKPGERYKMKDAEMTNRRLADLQQFKYINVEFVNIHGDMKPWFRDTLPKKLDCYIRLTRSPKQSFTVEWLGKNTSRDLGTEISLIYSNKNLFRGSEVLNLNTNLALETQRIIGDDNDENVVGFLPFNTIEYGVNANIDLPKFLLPIDQSRFPAYFKPRTRLSSGYNYRQRPDYSRHLINLSFGYRWNETKTKQHQILVADINSIKLNPDSSFIEKLNEIDNKKFLSAYEDHLIVGGKYTFILNTQGSRKKEPDFWYLRTTFEPAGLVLNTLASAFNANQDAEGNYEIFRIRYAQYVRAEADYRYFYRFNERNQLATRISLGVGIPYGNLNVLPFEKSFFVGGANGIRAWQLRSLGPGGFSGDVSNFDKIGDISLESSVEYRFPIYDFFKGGLFIDAGNVWLKDKNDDFPLGHFQADRFFKQIAIGTGFGLRLDFSLFVLRLDAGVRMVDPSKSPGNRWVLDEYKIKNTNINFGIGYPF